MAYVRDMTRTPPCLAAALALAGCAVTGHPSEPASLGQPISAAEMEAVLDEPGPVRLETVVAADWAVPLSGLLDLDHPEARAAGLGDREEPIQIYVFVLRHPDRGTFLVDSGVARDLRDGTSDIISPVIDAVMHTDRMRVHVDTASVLAAEQAPLAGVLLTHLHIDHILGLADVPAGTPVYVGAGEPQGSRFMNAFVQGTTDRALAGHAALRALAFEPDPAGAFAGVLDLFGDRSVFAIHVPGHTQGSMAFVVRTPEGSVLLAGDASHTRWGWIHGVGPGDFTEDHETGVESLAALRALAARHPGMRVQPGHQPALAGAAEHAGALPSACRAQVP